MSDLIFRLRTIAMLESDSDEYLSHRSAELQAEAAIAYNELAIKHHGEFAQLKKIEQIAPVAPAQPVARVDDLERGGRVRAKALGLGLDQPLYAAPAQPKLVTPYISQEHFDRAFPDAPITQPVNELVEALQEYVNNDDVDLHLNGIKQKALAALANAKAAQPLTKESAEKVLDAAELCRRWFVDEVGLTEAHPIVVYVTEAIEIMKGVRDVEAAAIEQYRDSLVAGVVLPEIGPHDHPEPQTHVWTKLEIRAIQAYARQAIADALAKQVPPGYKLVPVEPVEAQWGELARDIVFWLYMSGSPHHGSKLHDHLRNLGRDIPDWLTKEIPDVGHTPAKGTVAACIYRAMLEAAPDPKNK